VNSYPTFRREEDQRNANNPETEIKLNREALKYVLEYTYVGQLILFRDSSGKEIKKRIGLAWNKFKSLGFVLADIFHKLEIKKDVLESCVLPVLLYDARTWSVTHGEGK
jgi:hypothetical protein